MSLDFTSRKADAETITDSGPVPSVGRLRDAVLLRPECSMTKGTVTDYLERAREIAALADRKTGAEKKRLLKIAEAWLALADQAALDANQVGSANPTTVSQAKSH